MNILRNKSKASTFALILVLTIAATSVVFSPAVNSEEITVYVTAALSVRPNPVGVGQNLLLNFWLTPELPGWPMVYHNLTIKITDPDGTVITLGPLPTAGSDGTQWLEYTPDAVGTWKFQHIYLGETFPAGDYTDVQPDGRVRTRTLVKDVICPPAQSPVTEITVQQEPVPYYPWTPLPTDPWERPIYAENREWWTIGGGWPRSGYDAASSRFNPYSQAPESAHILWTKPMAVGGLVGGAVSGPDGTEWDPMNAQYDSMRVPYPSLSIAGLSFYTEGGRTHCFDIRTGEEIWVKEDISMDALTADWLYGRELGAGGNEGEFFRPYIVDLSGQGLRKWDVFTGDLVCDVTLPAGITSGTFVDPFFYTVQTKGNQKFLVKWNTHGTFTDFARRISEGGYNVSYLLNGISTIWNDVGFYLGTNLEGYFGQADPTTAYPMGAFDAATGDLLWSRNRTDAERSFTGGGAGYGLYVFPLLYSSATEADLRVFKAINMYDGTVEWLSEPGNYPWGDFWAYSRAVAYGNFYQFAYDGVYAINATTGKIEWIYEGATDAGFETPYEGHWPFFGTPLIADGKIYIANAEHTPAPPLWRGGMMHCIDADTGAGIWNISFYGGYFTSGFIADGYLVYLNQYDSQLYCFGKGKSATTVSVSQGVIVDGDSVLIQGTVLDQSSAQPGTPCVSKESMSGWMEYLHMQQPCAANVEGVPVDLRAMRSDGSIIEIGRVTSDMTGQFAHMWTPPDEDFYLVTATFNGDESYGSSWAETALGVTEAPAAPHEPEPEAETDYTPMFAGIIAAVAVAIVIGIVNLYALRKRT